MNENRQYVSLLHKYGLQSKTTLNEAYRILSNPWLERLDEIRKKSPDVKRGIEALLQACESSIAALNGIGSNVYNFTLMGEGDKWNMTSFKTDFFGYYWPNHPTLPVDVYFDQFITQIAKGIQLAHVTPYIKSVLNGPIVPPPQPQNIFPSFVDPILANLIPDRERKAKNKNGEWDSLIRCAAFVELLWDNGYFGKKEDRVKKSNEFAKNRYGIDIRTQLLGSKKSDRNTHKDQLKRLFR